MRTLCFAALIFACSAAMAADPVATRIGTTQTGAAAAGVPAESSRQLAELTAEARLWGISLDEMRRAQSLKQFRSSFTNVNLSPIEILGIHARTDAERKRYAEIFARILHDDTVRILEFQVAHAAAMHRLYPNEKVLDLPKGALPRSFFGTGGQ